MEWPGVLWLEESKFGVVMDEPQAHRCRMRNKPTEGLEPSQGRSQTFSRWKIHLRRRAPGRVDRGWTIPGSTEGGCGCIDRLRRQDHHWASKRHDPVERRRSKQADHGCHISSFSGHLSWPPWTALTILAAEMFTSGKLFIAQIVRNITDLANALVERRIPILYAKGAVCKVVRCLPE